MLRMGADLTGVDLIIQPDMVPRELLCDGGVWVHAPVTTFSAEKTMA